MYTVLKAIEAGHATRAEIVAATGITDKQAQSALANLLHARKIKHETSGVRLTARGRPHNIYSIRREAEPVRLPAQSIVEQAMATQPNSVFAMAEL